MESLVPAASVVAEGYLLPISCGYCTAQLTLKIAHSYSYDVNSNGMGGIILYFRCYTFLTNVDLFTQGKENTKITFPLLQFSELVLATSQ